MLKLEVGWSQLEVDTNTGGGYIWLMAQTSRVFELKHLSANEYLTSLPTRLRQRYTCDRAQQYEQGHSLRREQRHLQQVLQGDVAVTYRAAME